MTLIEEEEIAVMVKKTLADALPIGNTPGPVDVTGEEGFAALSLVYLDARGDLFIKEQQNQPLVWDGTDITIGPTNSDHITIDTTSIKFFKDSDTEKGSLSGDTWTLGTSTAYHTSITNTAVQLKNGSTVLTEIAGGNATIGEVAADKGNVHILAGTPAKIQLRNDTSVLAQLSSSTLTLGATTAEHISISGVNVQFYNAGTVKGSLSTDTWTLGTTGNNHVAITDSAVSLKNSGTTLASLAASTLTLGATAAEHIVIDGDSIDFLNDDGDIRGTLEHNTWKLGDPDAYHTEITNAGFSVKSDADITLTNIAGGNVTIGLTGSAGNINSYITGSSFSVRDNTTKMLELTVAGSSQIIQIGATAGSQQAWQFLKLNDDRDLSLRPSAATAAATTFKVVDYSTSWKGFRVYHANSVTGGETTFLTSNVGHVSSGTESVVNRLIAGGHNDVVGDDTPTDLFQVTIAADQFFYGTVTIISWQDVSVSGANTTDLVRKYNVFAGYRGSAYPTTKIVLLSDFNMGGATLTADDFTVAESSNVFTFNVGRDLAADTTFPLAYTVEATTSSDVSTFINLLNT